MVFRKLATAPSFLTLLTVGEGDWNGIWAMPTSVTWSGGSGCESSRGLFLVVVTITVAVLSVATLTLDNIASFSALSVRCSRRGPQRACRPDLTDEEVEAETSSVVSVLLQRETESLRAPSSDIRWACGSKPHGCRPHSSFMRVGVLSPQLPVGPSVATGPGQVFHVSLPSLASSSVKDGDGRTPRLSSQL